MREVLESTRYVAENSRLVSIDRRAIGRYAGDLSEKGIKPPPWEMKYHFFDGVEKTVAYLLVLDSINFCFWPAQGKPGWEISYASETLNGYYAMAAALKLAVESGDPLTDADYLAELSPADLKGILGGQGNLQLLDRRAKILNELGRCLSKEYGGKAHKLVETAGKSALSLCRLMADKLASFRDETQFLGHPVAFYKRAQIFAADLYGAFEGKMWGHFNDMDQLTCFADYKLPQALRHLGILHYQPELEGKVDGQVLLEAGGREEVEIRANTVVAVDLISQECESMEKNLQAFEIDWILWNMGQDPEFKVKPYHRTRTIFY